MKNLVEVRMIFFGDAAYGFEFFMGFKASVEWGLNVM